MVNVIASDQSNITKPTNLNSYILFWLGQTFSLLGSNITNFAIIWWITITYQNALYLGILSFTGYIIGIFSAAIFGVYVDKWNHKTILITTDSLSLVGTIVLIILFLSGMLDFWSIIFITTLQGLLNGIQGVAVFAMIPALVPKEQRSRINSLNILGLGISGTLGPVIAAIMIASIGLNNLDKILYIDGLTFFFAVLTLYFINIPRKNRLAETEREKEESFLTSFSAGFSKVKQTKGSIAHIFVPASWNFFLSPVFVLMPLVIVDQSYFDGNAKLLSIVLASSQVGVIFASVLFASVKVTRNYVRHLSISNSVSIGGFGFILVGIYSINILILSLGMFVLGFSLPYHNSIASTIWQTVIPLDFQGRVISVRRLFTRVPQALSFLIMALLAEMIGFDITLLIGFLFFTLIFTYIWLFTDYRALEYAYAKELYGLDK